MATMVSAAPRTRTALRGKALSGMFRDIVGLLSLGASSCGLQGLGDLSGQVVDAAEEPGDGNDGGDRA